MEMKNKMINQKLEQKLKRSLKKAKQVIVASGLAAIMALSSVPARASNPADVTSDYRSCPVTFYKVCSDGLNSENPSQWELAIVPVSKSANVSVLHFRVGDYKMDQLGVAKKTGKLDTSLFADFSAGSKTHYTAGIDYSENNYGVGAVVDLNDNSNTMIGARASKGNITVYTMKQISSTNPVYGLSYSKDGLTVDTSYDTSSAQKQVRISKCLDKKAGTFIPELRIKSEGCKTLYGLAIGFMPK